MLTSVYWHNFAQNYVNLAPPLKPSAQDVSVIESTVAQFNAQHPQRELTILLCGVTPALAGASLPPGTRLLAIEQSESMIVGIWPGNNAYRTAVRGNWLELPLGSNACDVIIGDGCVNCLTYPDGYRTFFSSLHRVLARDGVVLMRVFARPSHREDVDEVFADLHAARISSFHIFKWRLAMALQTSTENGIVVNDIYNAWAARGMQTAALASHLGWSEAAINTISAYKNKETRLSFPTVDEVHACLPDRFEATAVRMPTYAFGERCPMFILRAC